jgi:hypothetical protein
MGIDSIFDRLRLRAPEARYVPFRSVSFQGGNKPSLNKCHENVARWIAENPDHIAARGWLVTSGFLFDKHTVVRSPDGTLFDITPLQVPTPFIEHPADDNEFSELNSQLNLVVFPDFATGGDFILERAPGL